MVSGDTLAILGVISGIISPLIGLIVALLF